MSHSDAVLAMENVSKKFRRGEIYDSLRDLIPAMIGKVGRRQPKDALGAKEFWALQDVSFEVALAARIALGKFGLVFPAVPGAQNVTERYGGRYGLGVTGPPIAPRFPTNASAVAR